MNEPGVPLDLPAVYNAAVDFVGRNMIGERSSNVAIIDDIGAHTYADLAERVDRAGNALRSLGLRREDRVAITLHDTIDFPAVFWGAIKAGIVPVCLNTLLTTASYDYITNDCRARVLVVSEALLERFEPILDGHPSIEQVVVSGASDGEPADGHFSLAGLLDEASPLLEAADTRRDEVAFWLYSSGSTGTPKGVTHVHGSLAQTAHLYGTGVLGIEASDVVLSAAKLFFAYGLGNSMTFPSWVGASTVLLAGRPTPEAVTALLREHQPSVFYGVPTLYAALLADEDFGPETSSRALRRCVSAGEALPEAIGDEWERRFGIEILDGIGSTEMLHIFVSNRPGDVRYGWSGRPVPGYDARVVHDDGADTADGEIGELLVRGPSGASQYWNLRNKSRATFVGEWTRTGDKYLRDEAGYYLYCGRTDDMFKVGGNWVSPFEVESAIAADESVVEAAVIARPDESGNLKPAAIVVLAAGLTGTDDLVVRIQEGVKQQLEAWKYPRWIEFVDELPKTATGKIQRYKLREREA